MVLMKLDFVIQDSFKCFIIHVHVLTITGSLSFGNFLKNCHMHVHVQFRAMHLFME